MCVGMFRSDQVTDSVLSILLECVLLRALYLLKAAIEIGEEA